MRIGPTWQIDADGRWALPKRTLGWDWLGWCGLWLQLAVDRPWVFTDEQARFVLHWCALDDDGAFVYRDGVLQRLKGWGKDPIGSVFSAVEAFGPARFAGWDADGQPVPADVPDAWVQIANVSKDATKKTMRLFRRIFTPEAKRRFGIIVTGEMVTGLGEDRMIQAVTSSPAALEGDRSTFVLCNETQLWLATNSGHEMAETIDRNNAKSPDGAARSLRLCNSAESGKDSVGERDRDAWMKIDGGRFVDVGLLYDSLEASPSAPLTAEAAPEVIETVRGDSVWLHPERIVKSILDPRNPPQTSRRVWYNRNSAAADAWISPEQHDACEDRSVEVHEGDVITLGFDGSVRDDHSALIGCLLERDHLFDLGVWVPSPETGEVDRADVDRAVREAFGVYDVVGFYSDLHPFQTYVDEWAEDFGDQLVVKAAAYHPIAWDIRERAQQFTGAVERLHAAIEESARKATAGQAGDRLTHDGSRRVAAHFYNARRAPNPWGISVRKEHRESARKIDSVPAAALARLARLEYLTLSGPRRRRRRRRTGVVW